MDKPEYRIVVPGKAYPHPRVTHREIRTAIGRRDRGKPLTSKDIAILRYLNYREGVMMAAMVRRIPVIAGPAEFHATFWFRNRVHGDRVNLEKAAEDGVAAAGIVGNDKQFLDGSAKIR